MFEIQYLYGESQIHLQFDSPICEVWLSRDENVSRLTVMPKEGIICAFGYIVLLTDNQLKPYF